MYRMHEPSLTLFGICREVTQATRKHAELEKLGLDTTELHRIETAEQVGITATL